MRAMWLLAASVILGCGESRRPPSAPVSSSAERSPVADRANEPATAGSEDPRKGCVWVDVFEILEQLYFDPGSAQLSTDAASLVDAIAATINANPRIEKLGVVGGHEPDEPDAVARDRAAAVTSALIAKGVPAQKLEAHGYLSPISHEPGRNRQVWFVMLRVTDGEVRPLTGDARWIPWDRNCAANLKAHREQGERLDCDCLPSPASAP